MKESDERKNEPKMFEYNDAVVDVLRNERSEINTLLSHPLD